MVMSTRGKLPLLAKIGSALGKWLSHLLLKRTNTKLDKTAENKYINRDDLCLPQ